MRIFAALASVCTVFIGLLLGSSSAFASTCDRPTTTRPCRTVVASIREIQQATTWAGNQDYDYISVACYYGQATGYTVDNSICAGGGDFDRLPSGDASCSGQKDDGATLILDKDNDCYFRKNFGLNGVVDARQCGVVGDGQPQGGTMPGGDTHPDDAKVLNSCMGLVSQLTTKNLQNSLSIVSTGGGVILDNTIDIKIPLNVTLECGGTFTSGSDNDYRIFKSDGTRNLTSAIVIDPTNHGVPGSPAYSIKSTGKNATYKDCTVVAGAGARDANNKYLNPYSPSVFYPDCQFPYDGTNGSGMPVPCTETAEGSPYRDETRASTAIQSAFSNPLYVTLGAYQGVAAGSAGILSTSGMNVQNVRIVGFGTCIAVQGPKPLIQNVDGDCHTGVSIDTSDVPMIENTAIGADVTTGELALNIKSICWDSDQSLYKVTVDMTGSPDPNFQFQNGDIVWIAPQGGTQSAIGYWVISNSTAGPCPGFTGASFDLSGSKQSVTISGTVNNIAGGYGPNVLSNIYPTNTPLANFDLRYVQPGQTVSDPDGCSSGLTVTRVWPAKGLVYLSGPVTCTGTGAHLFTFTDTAYAPGSGCALTTDPEVSNAGCAQVDPNFRWGDGIFVSNSGGMRAVNCQIYEHLVSWHMYDGTRSALFSNCTTGNASDLPDRNLDALIATSYPSGNIISVLIDGTHNNPEEDHETDACETAWSNMRLGQHRQTNIVIQSNCDAPNRFSNIATGGGEVGIDMEVDAGGMSMVNAEGNTGSLLLKADKAYLYANAGGTLTQLGPFNANLSISNNRLPDATLVMANADAAASTVGCGNTFAAPTPYLCAPSSFTQLPGGRLTLIQGQPVMTADTSATNVYYSPYVSQQVPVYNPLSGVFGLVDITPAGLSLNLPAAHYTSSTLFDVFAGIDSADGAINLCSNQWSSSSVRSPGGEVTPVNGVWVNQSDISCFHNTGNSFDCPPLACTYLGTLYIGLTAGQVSQQFGPVSGSGGGAPCLCLYNAYNHVTLGSASADTNANYSYGTPSWRLMDGSAANSVSVVDGLGQMQISAQLNDLMNNSSGSSPRSAQMGMLFGSSISPVTPALVAQANSVTTKGSYTVTATHPPIKGYWQAQAVENVTAGSGSANFGGSPFQQLSVQVAD